MAARLRRGLSSWGTRARTRATYAPAMNQLALAQHDDDKAPRSDDELGPLLRRALGHPILTAADEVRLAPRVQAGDLVAKNQRIESNLRLVASSARRYRGGALSSSDLVQEGTIGLVRA